MNKPTKKELYQELTKLKTNISNLDYGSVEISKAGLEKHQKDYWHIKKFDLGEYIFNIFLCLIITFLCLIILIILDVVVLSVFGIHTTEEQLIKPLLLPSLIFSIIITWLLYLLGEEGD